MTTMTLPEARSILAEVTAGTAYLIPTLAVLRAAAALNYDCTAWTALADEVHRRRRDDARGLMPRQPTLSARMKAFAEGQPEPPTFPAPGMTYGFPECPGWPEYGCDYASMAA